MKNLRTLLMILVIQPVFGCSDMPENISEKCDIQPISIMDGATLALIDDNICVENIEFDFKKGSFLKIPSTWNNLIDFIKSCDSEVLLNELEDGDFIEFEFLDDVSFHLDNLN